MVGTCHGGQFAGALDCDGTGDGFLVRITLRGETGTLAMTIDREALKSTLTEYTCGQRCMGHAANHGGCCTVETRDFIIGPIADSAAFLARLSEKTGRAVPHAEVFVDHAEGRALFPDRATWQRRENYPALRVVMDTPRHACRLYDDEAGACTVYEIRPEVCRRFLCDPLRHLLSLV